MTYVSVCLRKSGVKLADVQAVDLRAAGAWDPDVAERGRGRERADADRDRLDDLVRRRVDPRDRVVADVGDEDGPVGADRGVLRALADVDRRHDLAGLRIDPRDGVRAVVRDPDRVARDRDRARRVADAHRRHPVRVGVDPDDAPAEGRADPDRAAAVAEVPRAEVLDVDPTTDLVRPRVDPVDVPAIGLGRPDRAGAIRDVPDLVAHRDPLRHLHAHRVDADHRARAVAVHPDAARADRDAAGARAADADPEAAEAAGLRAGAEARVDARHDLRAPRCADGGHHDHPGEDDAAAEGHDPSHQNPRFAVY